MVEYQQINLNGCCFISLVYGLTVAGENNSARAIAMVIKE